MPHHLIHPGYLNFLDKYGPQLMSGMPSDRLAAAEALRAEGGLDAFDATMFRTARPGEELLYELAVADCGAALYLVSDGVGVASPPHEHRTGAVIVGLRGIETHTRYERTSVDQRTVTVQAGCSVGPGELLAMGPTEIHSTIVLGNEASFHLHAYGIALDRLPLFATRCFRVG